MEFNKTAIVIGLLVCFGLGIFAAGIYYSGRLEPTSWARGYTMSEVIGTQVKNPVGEIYGTINDFVIDTNGRVPFAILTYGEKSVALPYEGLYYDRERKYLTLYAGRERLDSAQAFDRSLLTDRKWAEDNYRHFGQAPYWTEVEDLKESSEGKEDSPAAASGEYSGF